MKKMIRFLVTNPLTWAILNTFYKLFYRFKFEKELISIENRRKELSKHDEKLREIFKDLTVRSGIFKGMKYPEFTAHGSSLYPKLLGSYECELYPDIEKLLKSNYEQVIDIGCAEGFYAVGLAMISPHSKVLAYDINENALNTCKSMAETNKIKNIEFGSFCSQEILKSMDLSGRNLIVCDCEGYEKELFSKGISSSLKTCDILIELHDLYDESISPSVLGELGKTHNARFIYSENTFEKLDKFEIRKQLSDFEIQTYFAERNGIMRWAILTPKA